MASRIRAKLTYANVVATLALFLVVSGGAAYAASHLGKNSVGTKQLKKNAVTTAKIKNGAVTGPKIKVSTLGTVPTSQRANTLAPSENWHEVGAPGEPPFLSGWGNVPREPNQPETVAFYKDQEGVVHLKGEAIAGAPSSTTIFKLPAGYRPATDNVLSFAVPCICSGNVNEMFVFGPQADAPLIAGYVDAPFAATGATFDGVTFRAEN